MDRHTWLDHRRARSSPAMTRRRPRTTITATPIRRNKIGWRGCCAPARRPPRSWMRLRDRPVLLDGGRGRARGLAVALDLVRLQELPYVGEYDAVVTIYAMGNVPPEDWPPVLANLHRTTRPGGLFDLTVEEAAEPVIEEAYRTLTRRGLPAVRGEITDKGFSQEDGWGYRHFLLQSARYMTSRP